MRYLLLLLLAGCTATQWSKQGTTAADEDRDHVDDRSRVERRVIIEEGAEIVGSVVRGPAIIGARTRLVDTYVGPYTSIAADCVLIDAEIEHSVVLENSRIEGVHRIQDSLLGRSVEVERTRVRPRATRLMLGDHSRADLE